MYHGGEKSKGRARNGLSSQDNMESNQITLPLLFEQIPTKYQHEPLSHELGIWIEGLLLDKIVSHVTKRIAKTYLHV